MIPTDSTVLTVAGLGSLAAAVLGIIKAWSWVQDRTQRLVDKETKRLDAEMISAVAKVGLAEIKVDTVEREFMVFRLEVAREYVRHEHVKALDDRIDKGFIQLRADLNDLRAAVMDSLADGRPPRRRADA